MLMAGLSALSATSAEDPPQDVQHGQRRAEPGPQCPRGALVQKRVDVTLHLSRQEQAGSDLLAHDLGGRDDARAALPQLHPVSLHGKRAGLEQMDVLAADKRRAATVDLYLFGLDCLRSPLLDTDLIGADRLATRLVKCYLLCLDTLGAALDHLHTRSADVPGQLILELGHLGDIAAVGFF